MTQAEVEQLTNDLIAAIWPALDAGCDKGNIRDAVNNVIDAWEPKEEEKRSIS